MPTLTLADYKLARNHGGYGYWPDRETADQGRVRSNLVLARDIYALRNDPTVFVVWSEDGLPWDGDMESPEKDGYTSMCCYLCVDCDAVGADLIRGYSQADGIFERPGAIVQSLFSVWVKDTDDPYCRVVEGELYGELYGELEHERERCIVRGDN